MKEIKGIIEKGKDGFFAIRSENKIGRSYLGGFGESVEEAKEDFESSIDEAIEDAKANRLQHPEKETLHIIYQYDIPSFFNYFDFINVSRFAAYVGINESKMRQYKSGIVFPGEKTTQKIFTAARQIGSELVSCYV